MNNSYDIMKHMFEVSENGGNELLILASENGDINLVKELLEDLKVNPAIRNNEALFRAVSGGWEDIVKLLLNHKDVNISGDKRIFREAIYRGASTNNLTRKEIYKRIAKMLVEKGAEWRILKANLVNEIFNEESNNLKDFLTNVYLSIKKENNNIDKNIIKNITYKTAREELCQNQNNVPSMKLSKLAKMLKIRHNQKTTKDELCKKIDVAINNVFL